MPRIGIIRERKTPPDNRVPLTPDQCRTIMSRYPGVTIAVEPSPNRCFPDEEYRTAGIPLQEDLGDCDLLIGVKEVPAGRLIPEKTYLFFSHTKKAQPHNKPLMQALIRKRIRMVDFECLTHPDEQRILGFGLFAGIVGAHNGLLTYGRKFNVYQLPPAHSLNGRKEMIETYPGLVLPPLKIAVTGSGKVAAGVLDVMTGLEIEYVEPQDYLVQEFDYPVYTHLKGDTLYKRKDNGTFHRNDFHANPGAYRCLFGTYIPQTDILMNGIYWDENIARLFEKKDIHRRDWRISVIADITCDENGSVPVNLGASTIADPVYGVNRHTGERDIPFQPSKDIIDVMAVDNLPNELPRDASEYFGIQFEKYVLGELLRENSDIIRRATICTDGRLTKAYDYLSDYAYS